MKFTEVSLATYQFSEKVWVHCHKCDELGLITSVLGKINIPVPIGFKSSFLCTSCGLKKNEKSAWVGFLKATISKPCGFCGVTIHYSSPITKEPFNTIAVDCSSCGNPNKLVPNWETYRKDIPCDPFFGMQLALQTNIKGNVLWFYNLDHLDYLRNYVKASLRTVENRHKYALISNLPTWVKLAKNRDIIVKKLDQLEKDFLKKSKF